jgi:hypothetical protein
MSGIFYKGLVVLFSLALSFSVATWLRARQELQAVTVANVSLRKTLGDLTIAMAEKDREIDRMAQSPCDAGEQSQSGPGSAPRRGTNLELR